MPPCVATPDFLHAAMRPVVIAESEVEISTEDCCEEEEDEEMVTLLEEPEPEPDHEPVRKRRGRQKHVCGYVLVPIQSACRMCVK